MRRCLFPLLLGALLGASCATPAQRPPGGEIIPSDEGIPEEIRQFCLRQCTDEIDGVQMIVRGCYGECVKDLMRRSSHERLHPDSWRWTPRTSSAR